jgi:hypothetical protein
MGLIVALAWPVCAGAASPTVVGVQRLGRSGIGARFGPDSVYVEISACVLDVGACSGLAAWTDSTFDTTNIIRSMTMFVNRHEVLVPGSVWADAFDPSHMRLQASGHGVFKLTVECGDGHYGFEIHVVFDRKRVRSRTVLGGEPPSVAERTVYMP